MPNPTTSRNMPQFPAVAASDIVSQQLTYLVPPKGMDTQTRIDELDKSTMRLIKNLLMRDNHLVARDGTTTIGDVSSTQLIYATAVKLSTGKTWILRWRTDGVDYFKGGVWTPCSGDRYSAPASTQVSVTGWADTLVFTVGVGQLYSLSFDNNLPTISLLDQSPTNIGHVSTFDSRIMASDRAGSSVHWCVKLDNTDWTGEGSGSEDLRSSPGSQADQQTAVVPLTDEAAYCVRTDSVWQMTLTGNFDAPFQFTRLYGGIGSEYPGTVVGLRQAVAFMTRDSIVKISPQGLQDIGKVIREQIRLSKAFLRDTSASFDARNNEYVLSVPDDNSLNAQKIWRWNDDTTGWVQEVYPFPAKSISFVRYIAGLSIDQLTGTIDQLPGTIDDLGQSDKNVGLIFAMGGTSKLVARNDDDNNDAPERDVNSAGITVAGGWRVETGMIVPDKTVRMVTVIEMQLEYECEVDADITFEYCTDGVDWFQYAARTLPATSRPRIVRVRNTIEREEMQLAINCAATPNFRLIAFHVFAISGGMVADARA